MSAGLSSHAPYRDAFARLDAAPAPDWLRNLRRRGWESFSAQGFPSIREEAWRHTDMGVLSRTAYVPAPPGEATAKDLKGLDVPAAAGRLVFVNGRFSPALSSASTPGLNLGSLSEFLSHRSGELRSHFEGGADFNGPFAALNDALFQDGAFIHLPPGAALSAPIQVIFLTRSGAAPAMTHPRLVVLMEAGSQAALVESHVGDGPYFTNVRVDVRVGENARLAHYRIQRESLEAVHVSSLRAWVDRLGRYASCQVSIGGRLVRNDLDALLGEAAEADLDGLVLAAGDQHVDNRTLIDHLRPHGTSRELYKSVLAGRARSVFRGEVVVRPEAQKTNSVQSNNNLLLSPDALAHSQPELRIQANDVKCKHGAAIGQLSPDALFYFRSRGIGEAQARRLLVQGFAAEVLDKIEPELLREDLLRWTAEWLSQ